MSKPQELSKIPKIVNIYESQLQSFAHFDLSYLLMIQSEYQPIRSQSYDQKDDLPLTHNAELNYVESPRRPHPSDSSSIQSEYQPIRSQSIIWLPAS